jgi:Protein of unknown function (DUF1552)
MAKFRLNRRTVLRGAGSIAIALPWLEIMEPEKKAHAATTPAQRFLAVYTPGGTVVDDTHGVNKWRPTGTETAPIMSPILAPLKPIMDLKKLLIVDGLDMTSKNGEQHQAGIIAWMTGTAQMNAPANGGLPGTQSYASGPSIDQVIATAISKNKKKFPSIQMAVRWGTGKAHGLLSPISCANFEDSLKASPIAPELDPQLIFTNYFGSANPTTDPVAAAALARKKSVLDYVVGKYTSLVPKLGTTDRMTLQQHLDKIRELEMGLSANSVGAASCTTPMKVDTTGYNPGTALCGTMCAGADTGSILDIKTDSMIPVTGTFMMDMMVMALACDLTAVGTFQWTDTEAKHTFPWLKDSAGNVLKEHHHFYQHDGGFRPLESEIIYTWYSTMHLHLLQAMDAVKMGADGHTLLDESVVFFGSELSQPPTHSNIDMPFMLGGAGGGLRGGRWVHYTDKTNNRNSHNNLLVSILNLFGLNKTTFGDPSKCAGALANIT